MADLVEQSATRPFIRRPGWSPTSWINRIAVAEGNVQSHRRPGSGTFEDAAAATKAAGKTVLVGPEAFALRHLQFPIELTLEMAAETGFRSTVRIPAS